MRTDSSTDERTDGSTDERTNSHTQRAHSSTIGAYEGGGAEKNRLCCGEDEGVEDSAFGSGRRQETTDTQAGAYGRSVGPCTISQFAARAIYALSALPLAG